MVCQIRPNSITGGYFTSPKPEYHTWFGSWVWSNSTQTDPRTLP